MLRINYNIWLLAEKFKKTKMIQLSNRIRRMRMKCTGRIRRMSDNKTVKQIFRWEPSRWRKCKFFSKTADGRHFENRQFTITRPRIIRSSPNFAGRHNMASRGFVSSWASCLICWSLRGRHIIGAWSVTYGSARGMADKTRSISFLQWSANGWFSEWL